MKRLLTSLLLFFSAAVILTPRINAQILGPVDIAHEVTDSIKKNFDY